MSFWSNPTDAANKEVNAPNHRVMISAVSENSNTGELRISKYTPEHTSVAAWISELTGVGPSIEAGNQIDANICADLALEPIKSKIANRVINSSFINGVTANIME